MEQNIASIWLKFPRHGKKPFLLGALYREYRRANQQLPNISGDPALQKQRWSKALDQWANIQDGIEVLVVCDLNLDFLKWGDLDLHHREMIEVTKDKVETKGFAQMVKGATRFWHNTVPSLIDQAWSKNPDNTIHCKTSADQSWIIMLSRLLPE